MKIRGGLASPNYFSGLAFSYYLKTMMCENKFSVFSSLCIEQDVSNTVDVHDIIAHYAAKANRQLQFYCIAFCTYVAQT